MIFNVEVKDGNIINIDGCTNTKQLAAKWEQNIPEQWPNKTTECHFALKLAIEPNSKPDNWDSTIILGDYVYSLSDDTRPATKDYLREVGVNLANVYNKWKSLVKVPNVLPDGIYTIMT